MVWHHFECVRDHQFYLAHRLSWSLQGLRVPWFVKHKCRDAIQSEMIVTAEILPWWENVWHNCPSFRERRHLRELAIFFCWAQGRSDCCDLWILRNKCLFLPKFIYWNSYVMVLEVGLWEGTKSWEWSPHEWDYWPYKKDTWYRASSPLSPHSEVTQREGKSSANQRGDLH